MLTLYKTRNLTPVTNFVEKIWVLRWAPELKANSSGFLGHDCKVLREDRENRFQTSRAQSKPKPKRKQTVVVSRFCLCQLSQATL